VVSTERHEQTSRCTLCPAGCELGLARYGPEIWRTEYPPAGGRGLCPRGGAMGELLGHRNRIVAPRIRRDGRLHPAAMSSAVGSILEAAGEGLTVLLDGNLPAEQMAAAAGWQRRWGQLKVCLVVPPAEEQLLLGVEASGAGYLASADLAECDGFVIVGDAFAANPLCSRGVFDRRRSEPRTPIVVIDPGFGSASKFASHRMDVAAGTELASLASLASSAGVLTDTVLSDRPAETAAGVAIAGCKRVGVILAAEYGRGAAWRQIGYLAGRLAVALGGGVAVQTTGANALAAVRLGLRYGTLPLAAALADSSGAKLVIGCDLAGMLGMPHLRVLGAAAALPNATTEAASVVLPVAMSGEYAGTYLLDGGSRVWVRPLMPPPAGVPTADDLIGALAMAAGVRPEPVELRDADLERAEVPPPPRATMPSPPDGPVLLLGRRADHAGAGELTAHAAWQSAAHPIPELRIAPQDAQAAGIKNFSVVNVRAGGESVRASARVAPELPAGVMVLPEGFGQARALLGGSVDDSVGAVVASPAAVEVSA